MRNANLVQMIKIVIVEDNKSYRDGIELILNSTEGFKCIATFDSCETALVGLKKIQPDIMLLDMELPGMFGYEGIPKFKMIQQNLDIIVLTGHGSEDFLFKALRNGACGYLTKTTAPAKLIENIQTVYDGGSVMSPKIARMLSDFFNKSNEPSPLTSRETEVLKLAGLYNKNKDIADKLFISIDTIRAHFKNIYSKLGVHSKTEAYSKASKKNWL